MKYSTLIRRLPGLNQLYKWHRRRQQWRNRYQLAMSYYQPKLENIRTWVDSSAETTNFTYELDPINIAYLASFVSQVTNTARTEITRYIDEIMDDSKLKSHIRRTTESAPVSIQAEADQTPGFSRRIGWYAVARATKPKVIVETGVDKGLGACILCAALKANAEEGVHGHYFGTDINPQAGWLLTGPYAEYGELLYGDSITSLQNINEDIDLFINDSDHSSDYERREYETIVGRLTAKAVILGDNAHCNRELLDFSLNNNRQFLYWQEWPRDHWYPGSGIGFSFIRRDSAVAADPGQNLSGRS